MCNTQCVGTFREPTTARNSHKTVKLAQAPQNLAPPPPPSRRHLSPGGRQLFEPYADLCWRAAVSGPPRNDGHDGHRGTVPYHNQTLRVDGWATAIAVVPSASFWAGIVGVACVCPIFQGVPIGVVRNHQDAYSSTMHIDVSMCTRCTYQHCTMYKP